MLFGADGLLPEWAAALFAVLGVAGTGGAAAWAWFLRQRDREKARREKDDAKVALPYKQLFADLKGQLEKANEGFQRLQDEHADCREKVARLEERSTYQEGRLRKLEGPGGSPP